MTKRETCRYAKKLIDLRHGQRVVVADLSACENDKSAQAVANDADCECCKFWEQKETTDAD